VTGDFIAGIVMVAIVDYGTIVDCELDSPFAYSYHQRQVSILPNSNIIKFEIDLLKGTSEIGRLTSLSGGFLFVFAWNFWRLFYRQQIKIQNPPVPTD
jgi:hypothetical protein